VWLFRLPILFPFFCFALTFEVAVAAVADLFPGRFPVLLLGLLMLCFTVDL
jgi:hypothetical protein